jgi:hypothetical protein
MDFVMPDAWFFSGWDGGQCDVPSRHVIAELTEDMIRMEEEVKGAPVEELFEELTCVNAWKILDEMKDEMKVMNEAKVMNYAQV